MMRFILFLCFFVARFVSFSQDSVIVVIKVVDKKSGERVPNVNATIKLGNNEAYFQNGYQSAIFLIKVPNRTAVEASFVHMIYETGKVSFNAIRKPDEDTIYKEVALVSSRIQYVNEMIVKPVGTPYTVYHSERLSVSDFEILEPGKFLLLTYPKRLQKGSEILLFHANEGVLNSFEVPGEAVELVRDYRGNSHLVCKEHVLTVMVEENNFKIARLENDYFTKYVAPIIDTNQTKMYFSNFAANYPAFDYFSFDQYDSTYVKVKQIVDAVMMEMYMSEFKFVDQRTKLWAHQQQLETGIPKEVWVGATVFTQSIYYRELYAPMFHRNDSLFLFDYYSDKLSVFDYEGNPLDSIPIYHHYQPKSTGWRKELIQDQVTGQIYARFEKDGNCFIGLIDTKTGEVVERIKLEFKYVDKIYVYDNFVYYIYRPYESVQKKYLYKEQLPYKFSKEHVLGAKINE